MSYARFGWWESDVYIFATTIDGREVIECCGCHVNDGASITCDGPQEMLDHVRSHREFGDHVPSDVDERLQWEIDHHKATGITMHDWLEKNWEAKP